MVKRPASYNLLPGSSSSSTCVASSTSGTSARTALTCTIYQPTLNEPVTTGLPL